VASVDPRVILQKTAVKEGNCCLPLSKAALTMQSFIFSRHPAPRLARHLAFWAVYFLNNLLTHESDVGRWWQIDRNTFETGVSDALRFLPLFLLAVYSALYLILPIYLRKRKISLLIGYAFVLLTITVPAGYYIIKAQFERTGNDSTDKLEIFSQALHICMANLISVAVAAVIIKIMKDYWLRQRENEFLALENIRNKLHLLKMQMHPRILFASLQRIYLEIDSATGEAPEMILKLSDLLSYLLYESDSDQVPLSKEINMIENYLALKRLEYKQRIDLRLETIGQLHLHRITPGLFLPLLEIGIERSGGMEKLRAVSIQLRATGSKIHFSLTSNIPGAATAKDPIVQMTLRMVKERLQRGNFQQCKLDLRSGTDSLTIVMQLERDKSIARTETVKTVNPDR
jgi:two-component system, LytTR family, sensor kinase